MLHRDRYELVHNITGLPLLHGEFSYTAIDSGVPNLRGARSCPHPPHCQPNHPFTLQRDRAEQAKLQVSSIVARPFVVGYHCESTHCASLKARTALCLDKMKGGAGWTRQLVEDGREGRTVYIIYELHYIIIDHEHHDRNNTGLIEIGCAFAMPMLKVFECC